MLAAVLRSWIGGGHRVYLVVARINVRLDPWEVKLLVVVRRRIVGRVRRRMVGVALIDVSPLSRFVGFLGYLGYRSPIVGRSWFVAGRNLLVRVRSRLEEHRGSILLAVVVARLDRCRCRRLVEVVSFLCAFALLGQQVLRDYMLLAQMTVVLLAVATSACHWLPVVEVEESFGSCSRFLCVVGS